MTTEDELLSNLEEDFEWNVENEIRLFEAMIGHKPVGINKHFHMACISEKFETLIGKPISSEVIWKHLGTMFDLSTLDKKESLPFPNDVVEFSLPESEYSTLMNEKLPSKTETSTEVKENLKASKEPAAVKETVGKKEKKADEEANPEVDKKEAVESESESKKGKAKDEKPVKRRGYRSLKDKKSEEETCQTPAPASKREEEPTSTPGYGKKEKKPMGKRSLRSRGDDSSSKSSTPPPAKRPRRI